MAALTILGAEKELERKKTDSAHVEGGVRGGDKGRIQVNEKGLTVGAGAPGRNVTVSA